MQQVKRANDGTQLALHSTLSPNQTASAVEIRSTARPPVVYSGGELLSSTDRLVVVNSSSNVTNPGNWWVTVVGAHHMQPSGNARCIDAEVMQGYVGLPSCTADALCALLILIEQKVCDGTKAAMPGASSLGHFALHSNTPDVSSCCFHNAVQAAVAARGHSTNGTPLNLDFSKVLPLSGGATTVPVTG